MGTVRVRASWCRTVTFVKGTRIRRRDWIAKPRALTVDELKDRETLGRHAPWLFQKRPRGRPRDEEFQADFWKSIEFDDQSSLRALKENGEPKSFLRVARHMLRMNRPKYDALDERSLERKARRYLRAFWKRIDDAQSTPTRNPPPFEKLLTGTQKIIADDKRRKKP